MNAKSIVRNWWIGIRWWTRSLCAEKYSRSMLRELSEYAPIGSDVALVVTRYGAPTRVFSGQRAELITPLDRDGKKLFEIDEVYIWELVDRNSVVDVLALHGKVQSYQISLLPPLESLLRD